MTNDRTKLSDDDHTCFHDAMRGVKVYAPPNRVLAQANTMPARSKTHLTPPKHVMRTTDLPTSLAHLIDPQISANSVLSFAHPGISNRQLRRLRQGREALSAHCDLHGYRQAEAWQRVADLIANSQQRGWRYVRIIHGKGAACTLKKMLDVQLRTHPAILAFCSCIARDGGTGAVYVLIKKPTANRDTT